MDCALEGGTMNRGLCRGLCILSVSLSFHCYFIVLLVDIVLFGQCWNLILQ